MLEVVAQRIFKGKNEVAVTWHKYGKYINGIINNKVICTALLRARQSPEQHLRPASTNTVEAAHQHAVVQDLKNLRGQHKPQKELLRVVQALVVHDHEHEKKEQYQLEGGATSYHTTYGMAGAHTTWAEMQRSRRGRKCLVELV